MASIRSFTVGASEYGPGTTAAQPDGAQAADRFVGVVVQDNNALHPTIDPGTGWTPVDARYLATGDMGGQVFEWAGEGLPGAFTPTLSDGSSLAAHVFAIQDAPATPIVVAWAGGSMADVDQVCTAPSVAATAYEGTDPLVIRIYAAIDGDAYDGIVWDGPTGGGVTVRGTTGTGETGTGGNPVGFLGTRSASQQLTGDVATGTLSATADEGGPGGDPAGWLAGTIVIPTAGGTQVETATGTADTVQLDATGAATKAATISAPPAGLALDARGVHQRGAQAAGERTVRLGATPVATERVAASSATSAVGLSAHGQAERAATAPGDAVLRLGTRGTSAGRIATATGRAALALPTEGTGSRQAAAAGSARVELGTSGTHQRVASSSGRVTAGMGSSTGAGARLAGSAGSAPLALSTRGFSGGYLILETTGRVGLGLSARGAGAKAVVVVGQADVQLRQHGQADRLGVSSARVGLGLAGSGPADRTGYAAGQSAQLLDAHGAAHSVATARGTRVTRLAADGAVDRIGYSDGRAPLGLVARGAGAGEGGTGTATGRAGLGLLAVGAGRKDAGTDGLVGLVLGTHRAVLARPGRIQVRAQPTGITIEGGPC